MIRLRRAGRGQLKDSGKPLVVEAGPHTLEFRELKYIFSYKESDILSEKVNVETLGILLSLPIL